MSFKYIPNKHKLMTYILKGCDRCDGDLMPDGIALLTVLKPDDISEGPVQMRIRLDLYNCLQCGQGYEIDRIPRNGQKPSLRISLPFNREYQRR